MSIFVNESPDSRDLNFGSNGGGQVLKYTVRTTAGETEAQIYLAALLGSFPYFNGFIRNDIKVSPNGAPHLWKVEISYGTTGVGGGDQPLGGVGSDGSPPTNPTAPASSSTPLTSGYSFSIRAPRLHFKRSRTTVASFKSGGGIATDRQKVIGVTKGDSSEPDGVDWPPDPSSTFKRTVAKATVTQGYLSTLFNLAGRVNDAAFYGWAAGEVIFLAADGQYTTGEGWSITFEFGVNENEPSIVISPDLPHPPEVISKRGWEYLWVVNVEQIVGTKRVLVADECYVEELIRPAPFALLQIGA
ncbi:Uncharacterized protein OS=Isosphaera pallida (strain ATCC 43644 / DSM 9630 / IS1B) GN=Isop_2424 PE=4 SV=1 [Gemmata massiliana]|uniref:Uncharacterized protein n=1 Tax=Gemmata massiliana TaxID=1210884 RepID=A0A6P2DLA3_9BACT|nr:hypothetical protein [Gemmata massiliana]VTS01533.1 Uncharacterized protein OS=Isosphaera pallida (strain ATCC 43644 / DSM 9630 / IS1B) GN=Isop_2424 PE=4 SV=1 [Gemmata massiliana]